MENLGIKMMEIGRREIPRNGGSIRKGSEKERKSWKFFPDLTIVFRKFEVSYEVALKGWGWENMS